jgi:membrane protein implicated in regulation of membrane protease activity
VHLEKKDLLLLIPATLLTLAGLGPDDPLILGPCLVLSWLSFLLICIVHRGPWKWRVLGAVAVTVILALIGVRRFHSVLTTTAHNEVSSTTQGATPPLPEALKPEQEPQEPRRGQAKPTGRPTHSDPPAIDGRFVYPDLFCRPATTSALTISLLCLSTRRAVQP